MAIVHVIASLSPTWGARRGPRGRCHAKGTWRKEALLLCHEVQKGSWWITGDHTWLWLDPVLVPDLVNGLCLKDFASFSAWEQERPRPIGPPITGGLLLQTKVSEYEVYTLGEVGLSHYIVCPTALNKTCCTVSQEKRRRGWGQCWVQGQVALLASAATTPGCEASSSPQTSLSCWSCRGLIHADRSTANLQHLAYALARWAR